MSCIVDRVVMDDVDSLAQDVVIANQLRTQIPSLTHCEDCSDPINEMRRAIGNIQYCVDCQNYHNKVNKRKQINLKC